MSVERKLENGRRRTPAIEILDLKDMDRETAGYALHVVSGLRDRRLNQEQVNEIYYNEGIRLFFSGRSPSLLKNQDYFLFYPNRVTEKIPPTLKIYTDFRNSAGHNEMRDIDDAIFSGTIAVNDRGDARYTGPSSTWMKNAPETSVQYKFGETINRKMLDRFGISR